MLQMLQITKQMQICKYAIRQMADDTADTGKACAVPDEMSLKIRIPQAG